MRWSAVLEAHWLLNTVAESQLPRLPVDDWLPWSDVTDEATHILYVYAGLFLIYIAPKRLFSMFSSAPPCRTVLALLPFRACKLRANISAGAFT